MRRRSKFRLEIRVGNDVSCVKDVEHARVRAEERTIWRTLVERAYAVESNSTERAAVSFEDQRFVARHVVQAVDSRDVLPVETRRRAVLLGHEINACIDPILLRRKLLKKFSRG